MPGELRTSLIFKEDELMVRRSSPSSKGLSLIEILIASFLLIVVGLVTWSFLKGSIQLSQRGHLRVKTQENVRGAIDAIQAELRQATRPPRVGTTPQYTSGILFPSTADASSGGRQRLIFLEIEGLGDIYQCDFNSYAIVEYAVMTQNGQYAEQASSGDGNFRRIVRKTWEAYDPSSTSTYIRGLSYSGGQFAFDPSVLNNLTPLQQNDLLTLPNEHDKVSMEIYHPPISDGSTRYEDRLFKVRLQVEQTLNNIENKREVFAIENQVNTR